MICLSRESAKRERMLIREQKTSRKIGEAVV